MANKEIVGKIIESADLRPDDLVLEIGPGKGILTEELAKKAGMVIAVEIDKVLSNMLRNKFSHKKNIEIIEGDILKIDINKIFSSHKLKTAGYKLIANIPYYITAPIIRLFLESEKHPHEIILMIQKEVAERICTNTGKMSILAVSVQYYAEPEILFTVPRENFDPAPEVDSAVIRISNIKSQDAELRKNFFRIVRAGFSAKRKTLANNLSNSFHLEKKTVEENLKAAGITPSARAQELSIKDWEELARRL